MSGTGTWAAKVRTDGNGGAFIEWGWVAKSVAIVILGGIPSSIAGGAAMYLRMEHRVTVAEGQIQTLADVAARQQRWIEAHEKWAQEERDRIREAIEETRHGRNTHR